MRRAFLLFSILSLSLSSQVALADTGSEPQIWNAALLQTSPARGSGLVGWTDLHLRRGSGSTISILRPAIGYQFAPGVRAHIGYAFVPTVVDTAADRHEHRIWQEGIWGTKLGPIALSLRLRFEQRFGDGDDVGHRVRMFARGTWVPWPDLPFLLTAWDEFFYQFNDTDWGPVAGFDQNRFFVGPGFPVTPSIRFEVGYLAVFLDRSPDNRLFHVLAINAFATL